MFAAFTLLLLAAADSAPSPILLTVDDENSCVDEAALADEFSKRLWSDSETLHVKVTTTSSDDDEVVITVRAFIAAEQTADSTVHDPHADDERVVEQTFTVALLACQTVAERVARLVADAWAAHQATTTESAASVDDAGQESAADTTLPDAARDASNAVPDEGDDAPLDEGTPAPLWFVRPRMAFGLALGAPPLVPDARGSVEIALGHRAYPSFLIGLETTVFAPVGAGERTAVLQPVVGSVGIGFDRPFELVSLGARALVKGGAAFVWDGALDVGATRVQPWAAIEGAFLVVTRYGPTLECGIDVPLFPSAIVDTASGEEFVFPPAHAFVKIGLAFDFTW